MIDSKGRKTQGSKTSSKKNLMVYLKEHIVEGCTVLAVCDEDNLGKTYSNGRITITIDPGFYRGKLISIPKALKKISESPNSNLSGKQIVRAAIEAKLLEEDAILHIGKTDHAHRIII